MKQNTAASSGKTNGTVYDGFHVFLAAAWGCFLVSMPPLPQLLGELSSTRTDG